ncbi:MAG TPA: SCE4755 family polysaccharide monooxygenase-like protein [Polyangiales bacterium]|nr:SCE4755 family polysaccharide monooxygenase-like protein [Polyangiales bacterium]
MKRILCSLACLLALSALGETATARAEFRLTKPTAWIVEDDQGGPQKAGPCGPESGSMVMLTRQVAEVKAGATLDVEFSETTQHAGWFRISLAQNRSDFEGINFSGAGCSYDLSTVPTQPHGNVLADGVGKADTTGPTRTFKEKIKIPDQPCEKCTLQVVQVLTDVSREPSECVFYHCADIKIVAASGGGAGAASDPAAGSAAANGGASTHKTVSVGSTGGMGGEMAVAGTGGAPRSDSLLTQAKKLSGAAGTESKSDKGMKMMSASSGGAGGKPAAKSGSSMNSSTRSDADDASDQAEEEAEGDGEDATPKRERETEDGGCAVVRLGSRASLGSAALVCLASILFGARRRRSRAGSPRERRLCDSAHARRRILRDAEQPCRRML